MIKLLFCTYSTELYVRKDDAQPLMKYLRWLHRHLVLLGHERPSRKKTNLKLGCPWQPGVIINKFRWLLWLYLNKYKAQPNCTDNLIIKFRHSGLVILIYESSCSEWRYLHLFGKWVIPRVDKEERCNIRTPLMKTLDRRVETWMQLDRAIYSF